MKMVESWREHGLWLKVCDPWRIALFRYLDNKNVNPKQITFKFGFGGSQPVFQQKGVRILL